MINFLLFEKFQEANFKDKNCNKINLEDLTKKFNECLKKNLKTKECKDYFELIKKCKK